MPIGIGLGTAIAGVAGAGASVGAGVYGAKAQSKAAQQAAAAQTLANNRAADLEEKTAANSLAYLKEQDAAKLKRDTEIQALNKAQYDQEFQLGVSRYNDSQQRLAPYRSLGGLGVQGLTQGLQGGNGQAYQVRPRTLGGM